MRTKVGYVILNNNRELEYYFDKSTPHDWCGPTVKIASVDIFVEFHINALDMRTGNPHLAKTVYYEITDEKGRQLTKYSTLSVLNEYRNDTNFGYTLGWADGATKVIIYPESEVFLTGKTGWVG